MRELTLHLLDIVHNSVTAKASMIVITVDENTQTDRLKISIEDNGCGMDQDMIAKVTDPFVTSRTTRKVGMGIPLLKAAAEACNGWLKITSAVGKGTLVEVEFQRSHIDRMPLGDLPGTILSLVVGATEIHWVFHYTVNGKTYTFDDQIIKAELEGVPLTEPTVLKYLREMLEQEVMAIQPAI